MQLSQIIRTWRVFAGQMVLDLFGGLFIDTAYVGQTSTIVYSAAPVPNAALANNFVVTITDNVAFIVGAPLNPPPAGFAQTIWITFRNTSGGAHGAGTWNAIYKVSGNLAAIATANNRTIAFTWNGTNWIETFRSAADVAN